MQAIGMLLLAQVVPTTSETDVVRDIVLIGAGTGFSMPLYQNALMSAVPMSIVGVASSQLQFWRQLGATTSIALLGTILGQHLLSAGLGSDGGLGITGGSLAARDSIAAALHEVFLVATALIGIAFVASLFMQNVPLRGHEQSGREPVASFAD